MRRSSRWWTVVAIVLLGAAVWPAWAVELPPPEQGGPRPGVDIVVGQAGSHPQNVGEVLAMGAESIVSLGGPHVTFEATEPGWVYGQQAIFIITGSDQPWRITITGTAMTLEGGSGQYIPKSRIEMREAKKDTGWISISGGPMLQNPAGEEDMWMQIEFRIKVEAGDAAGHYQGDVFLEWKLASGAEGSIPLELHLNVAEFLAVTVESLVFPDSAGDIEGWIYSNEGQLTVNSNIDFYLAISAGADLVGGNPADHQIETALRVRQPIGDGGLWDTWGDLGGDGSGQADPDWEEAFPPGEDGGAPWPGSIDNPGLITTQGVNAIGLTGAAYRNPGGVLDFAGDYTTTITITVSVP